MKLIAKNFGSENHKIEFLIQPTIISAFYKEYLPELDFFETKKVFVEIYTKENYKEKLQTLLFKLEDYSGLELTKGDLKEVA